MSRRIAVGLAIALVAACSTPDAPAPPTTTTSTAPPDPALAPPTSPPVVASTTTVAKAVPRAPRVTAATLPPTLPAPPVEGGGGGDPPEGNEGAAQQQLEAIARCESGGSYVAENPTSTASGKYQVLDSTWGGYGGYQHASDAPPHVQEAFARELYARRGTQPWAASRSCWRGAA